MYLQNMRLYMIQKCTHMQSNKTKIINPKSQTKDIKPAVGNGKTLSNTDLSSNEPLKELGGGQCPHNLGQGSHLQEPK